MKSYTLKELQEIELQILIDFHGFCAEHGLQYYLIGGALLGAAKYQKCIPWDDDMDVAMPREDYERLKQIFKSDRYFLQNGQSDPVFSRCIQKIRLNDTIIAEKDCVGLDMHQGIYIDIFPIDFVSHDCPKTLKKRASAIRHLMSLRAIKGGYHSGRYGAVKKLIRMLLPISAAQIDKRIDKLCTLENGKERKYGILWLHNYPWYKQLHKAAVFGEGSKCRFCGEEFIAPADTDGFLKKVFGEKYMDEPAPGEQMHPHNYLNLIEDTDEG